jgi:hypothetical protein
LIWLGSSDEVIVVAAVATSDIGVHWGSCDPEYNDCRTKIESTIEEAPIEVNLRQTVKTMVVLERGNTPWCWRREADFFSFVC